MKLPTNERIKKIYKKYCLDEEKIIHSRKIARKSLMIAKSFRVNPEVVEKAALLHDIGYALVERPDLKAEHQYYTWKILCDEGFPELAEVACRHNFFGFTKREEKKLGWKHYKECVPRTITQMIISYADGPMRYEKNTSFAKNYYKKFGLWKKISNRSNNLIKKIKKRLLV